MVKDILKNLGSAMMVLVGVLVGTNPLIRAAAQPLHNQQVEQRPADLKLIISLASLRVGLPSHYLIDVARKESGLNPNAVNYYSTSKGLYQFIDSTWSFCVSEYGPHLDVTYNDRLDPYKSTLMAGMFTLRNKSIMEYHLERKVTYKELYLAHFAGAFGAIKLIEAENDTPVVQVLGEKVIRSNPELEGLTVGQAIEVITRGISN